jgi:hypothetical protein
MCELWQAPVAKAVLPAYVLKAGEHPTPRGATLVFAQAGPIDMRQARWWWGAAKHHQECLALFLLPVERRLKKQGS